MKSVDTPPCFFREKGEAADETQVAVKTRIKTKPEKEKSVFVCAQCHAFITQGDFVISISGHHEYTFANPHGVIYAIRLFSQASGCLVHGIPTGEFTWFPGFDWNFALCHQCLNHLGWFFQSSDQSFFGLISRQLLEEKESYH